jgi:ADP-ribosylglycohydrolase
MIGGIAGDVIGSVFEHNLSKNSHFPLFGDESTFTDDTVMTLAVAEATLKNKDYGDTIREFCLRHPKRRYGSRFKEWAKSWDNEPSDSFGNGSAMRVAPVGWAFKTLETVLEEAEKSAKPTHNSPEGIKGAKAIAASVFMARTGETKDAIKAYVESAFGYDLSIPYETLRIKGENYKFEPTCEKTVPPSLICFIDSTDYEDAVRKAVSLGWDSDTMACITGAIADAYYGGVPIEIEEMVLSMLPSDLKIVVEDFKKQYYGHSSCYAGVCQLCGTFQLISCMADAWATFASGECVCKKCSSLLGNGDFNEGWRIAKEKLKEQTHRFCFICMSQIDNQPKSNRLTKNICFHCLSSIPKTLTVDQYLEKLYRLRHRQHFQEFLHECKQKPQPDYSI